MKLSCSIIIILLTIILTECGMIDDAYNKVKNTTTDVKDNVYGWWSFGKEIVFGKEKEVISVNNNNGNSDVIVKHDKGIISSVLEKFENGLLNVRNRIHNIGNVDESKSDNNESESPGFVKNMYNKVKNKIVKLKDGVYSVNSYVFGSNVNASIPDITYIEKDVKNDSLYHQAEDETKILRNSIAKLFADNKNNFMNKSEFQNKWYKLVKDINLKRNMTDEKIKSTMDKEKELMNNTYNGLQENIYKLKNNSDVIKDDINKLSKTASETIQNNINDNLL